MANLFGRVFTCRSLVFKLFSIDLSGELNERRPFFMLTSLISQEIGSLLNLTLFSKRFKGDPNNFLLLFVGCKVFAIVFLQSGKHSFAGESGSLRSKERMLGFMRDENERAADSMRLDCGLFPAEWMLKLSVINL